MIQHTCALEYDNPVSLCFYGFYLNFSCGSMFSQVWIGFSDFFNQIFNT